MTPSERSLPIVEVRTLRSGFEVALPSRHALVATEDDARALVAREAPGSAIRFALSTPRPRQNATPGSTAPIDASLLGAEAPYEPPSARDVSPASGFPRAPTPGNQSVATQPRPASALAVDTGGDQQLLGTASG